MPQTVYDAQSILFASLNLCWDPNEGCLDFPWRSRSSTDVAGRVGAIAGDFRSLLHHFVAASKGQVVIILRTAF